MARYEVWAHVQASRGYQELTDSPTIAKLEYGGTDLKEAQRKTDEAVKRPEVLAATVEILGDEA